MAESNTRPVVYLDNAATSFPKAPTVAPAISEFLQNAAVNPGRSAHRLSLHAATLVEKTRLKLAELIHAEDHRRIIFTSGCTASLNLAIDGILQHFAGKGVTPHVVSTVVEHNSVLRPLFAAQQRGLVSLTLVPCDTAGRIDPADIARALTPDTTLVVVTAASNALGTIQPLGAIGKVVAEADGPLFLVDAAQGMGLLDIDVQRDSVDLLAFPGHKTLLGPTGIGGLYVGRRVCSVDSPGSSLLQAVFSGGTGSDSQNPSMPDLLPDHYEPGTLNTTGIAGLAAAAEWLAQHNPREMLQHEQSLANLAADRLRDLGGVTVFGPGSNERVGIVAFCTESFVPQELAALLDDPFNIAVRAGLHCAPRVHEHLGLLPGGTVRISFGPFNTESDVDAVVRALEQLL
ncbi:MAG TPA: aminotransferase class V-fold PLP-dependent enzyme [Phycisphaeraceae bacterium]|nr:aminotransferase class V-fold PLP-dependent enzyme [Phycisphaeraceae bacterium]